MGNWAITIKGVGIHDNTPPAEGDANRLVLNLVRRLLDAGHRISEAKFEVTGTKSIGGGFVETYPVTSHDLLAESDRTLVEVEPGFKAKAVETQPS